MHTRLSTVRDLGCAIQAQRKAQGLRQQDVADLIGASHVFVRHVEQGKPTVQLGRVLELLEQLGIELYADLPATAP